MGRRQRAFATGMILWIAVASAFSVLLGASRVPYSAAQDGNFFPGVRQGSSHETLSTRFLCWCWPVWRFLFSISLKLKTSHCRNSRHEASGAVSSARPVGVIFAAAAQGHPRTAVQDVVLSTSGCVNDDRVGLVVLADRGDAEMGARGDRAGGRWAFLIRAREMRQWPFWKTRSLRLWASQ